MRILSVPPTVLGTRDYKYENILEEGHSYPSWTLNTDRVYRFHYVTVATLKICTVFYQEDHPNDT